MNLLRIYKYSLALPLAIPIVTGLFLYASVELFPRPQTFEEVSRWQEGLNFILLVVVGSGLVGGIPYLLLATLLWREMKEMSERQVRTSLLWLPILMIVFFGVILAVFVPFAEGINSGAIYRFFTQWLAYGAFTLVLGYAYVFLVFGIVRLFRKWWPEWCDDRKSHRT